MLILIHLIGFSQSIFAQTITGPGLDDPYARPVTFQEEDYVTLTNTIKKRLAQEHGDTSQFYVAQSIVEFCGDDYDCLMNLHHRLRDLMFENHHYLVALALARASVPLAAQNNDPFNAGLAYVDMSFYYNDLGRVDSFVAILEKALPYFEKCGACFRIFKVRQELLERKYGDQPKVIVPLIEKNLEDARNMHCDIPSIQHNLKRLTVYTENGGMWDKFEKYLTALEQTLIPNPTTFEARHAAIYVHFGRAKLYLRENPKQIEKANESLLKALQISKDIPYPLFGVELLIELAKLEWERHNPDKAFAYLDEAVALGKESEKFYYLSKAYQTIARFREEQGRYKEALEAVRNQHKYSLEHKEKMAGLNLRDYYMQVEKSQMAAEQKNKELLLQLKDSQMNNLIYAIVFVALLSLGLFYGFHKQRQGKKALANQNALIQQQAEQLKSLDEAKSRFFANVSHELRTPLTLLTSPIQTLLKENQLSEKQIQLLQMADRSGKQLGQLINEILDLRKLEMGKMTVRPEPTELRAYFQTYFAQFESLAGQKQIDYQVVVDMPDSAIAGLDREKCRQILFNLLSNAFKFTPQGGRIEAKVQIQEQTLELRITNSGSGIHPDDLPHIFDRYFQTNRPDKPVEGGTGIGLALCREYAQLFGGSIHAASTPGADTVFRVTFPLHYAEIKVEDVTIPEDNAYLTSRSDAEIAPFASPTTPQSTDNKPTLLVVEDNPDLRTYIRMVLQDKYRVITAEHGQAAWEMIDKNGKDVKSATTLIPHPSSPIPPHPSSLIPHPSSLPHPSFLIPDLILSDLMMPVMDGYQLLERLKSDDATRHIPVVMLTARAEAQDKLTALRIGVDDYLTKPFDEEELLVRIENLLKNYAARREIRADETPLPEAPLMSQPDREWLETFEGYVQKHFASDLLSVSSLAYEFAMSESTLLRQLKRLTGLSPIQYIQEVRLNEARRLLEAQAYNSIAQVASKVGYDNAGTFTRVFKQRFGKLPSEMMKV